jgi:hypothetical protein
MAAHGLSTSIVHIFTQSYAKSVKITEDMAEVLLPDLFHHYHCSVVECRSQSFDTVV